MKIRLLISAWCIACCALLVVARQTLAADTGSSAIEQAVKAAYLYKFLGYVQWPPGAFVKPDAPFVIGVAGSDEMLAAISDLAGHHQVRGRPITVRRVAAGSALDGVHLLYVDEQGYAQADQLLKQAGRKPILTVTDGGDGGIIRFVLDDGRVRFSIALGLARRQSLVLSSRLLSVAASVDEGAAK